MMNASTPTGRWIDIASHDGAFFGAYLATPPTSVSTKSAPGLVVLQEIWGVNAHIRAEAEQYAADGYVVVAPDLFWRLEPRVELDYDAAGTEAAFAYRKRLDLDLADRDIAATATALRAMAGVAGGVGTVGYCLGGLLAYRAATGGTVDCAVGYYGGGIAQQLDRAAGLAVPTALHFGDRDAHITPEHVAAIEAALGGLPEVRIDRYPAADHGFNCPARPSYHQQSAALAHGRSLAFLATHLGVRA